MMRTALLVVAALVSVVLAACGSPIVGAECAPGLARCGQRCVDLENDPANCGRCQDDCGPFECRERMCGPGLRPDAGLDAGTERDAGDAGDGRDVDAGGSGNPPGVSKGGVGSPFTPDSGFSLPDDAAVGGCALGQTTCEDACTDTRADSQHCGGCGHACGSDQFCIAGVCEDACDAPLRLCAGTCVDVQVDEHHCGGCGHVCESGICDAGACADVIPGGVVVIGHDYSAAGSTITPAMKRIAGNAVFLATGAPVRTLIYRGASDAAACDGVIAAIEAAIALNDRGDWAPMTIDAAGVTEALRDADALVVCPQTGASDAEITSLGQAWGLAMAQFLYRGGVVALFETLTSNNAGTYHLLEPAGVFSASSRESVMPVRQQLTVQDPPLGVAWRVTPTYRSSPDTVHFLDIPADALVVVEDNAGEAVVVHRAISP